MEDEAVEVLCREASNSGEGVVVPANFNAPGQVVVSGDEGAVTRLREIGPERGAKRVIPLGVSGAFHSPLMAPAEAGLREQLDALTFGRPSYPVFSNVTAGPVETGETARDLLVRQLTSPVRWSGCIGGMLAAGADRFVELGPGEVLAGLNKRNAKGTETLSVGEPEELSKLG
jgi:[acyl-carrier-protein] S-malonyltransferase